MSMSYLMNPAQHNYSRSSALFAGGFGKQPTKKKNDISGPSLSEAKSFPAADEAVRYVTRKGSGGCVVTNHCPTFNLLYPGLRAVHSDPPIFEIDNFLSKELCESYILRSQEGTEIACQPLAGSASTRRTSRTKYLKYEDASEMIESAQRLTGISSEKYEEPQIVRYEPGTDLI